MQGLEPLGISLGFVIINYNSGDLLGKCITSIRSFEIFKKKEIIIVDTGSTDHSLQLINKSCVNIIRTGNIGYGAACNLGARQLKKENYLFFLNADTEIYSVDTGTLLSTLRKEPALVTPLMIQRGEIINNIIPFFSATCDALLRDVGLRWPVSREIENIVASDFDGWASGAALLVNNKVFKAIGGFDESFFLYYEELDLCYRIRNAGGRQIYLPSLVVKHVGGGSSDSLSYARTAIRYESKLNYWYKHGKGADFLMFRLISPVVIGIKLIRVLFVISERYKIPAYIYALRLYMSPQHCFDKIRAKTWWWAQALKARSTIDT